MKNITLIILIPFLIISLISCTDSLGIDPMVVKSALDPDTTGSGPEPYYITTAGYSCAEIIPPGMVLAWDIYYKLINQKIRIDTAKTNPRIAFDELEIRSLTQDNVYKNYGIKNRVIS